MLPSLQTSTVEPLHSRSNFIPSGPSGLLAAADTEPQAGDSSRCTCNTSPTHTSNEGLTDVLAISTFSSYPVGATVMRSRERICFQRLVMAAAVASATALCCVWCIWRSTADKSVNPKTGKVIPFTFQYFIYCFLGGAVVGTLHIIMTPIDVVKCRVQVGEYKDFRQGLLHIYYAEAGGSLLRALPLFFCGWVPTAWGNCTQGALKFCLYEVLKFLLLVGPLERQRAKVSSLAPSIRSAPSIYSSGVFQVVLIALASASAEVIADFGLAPWESVKIRMQTSSSFPTSLSAALPRMWLAEGLHGFYKGLVPLWFRQVPYTVMKFASFEMIVMNLASLFRTMGLLDADHSSTLGTLIVSLIAGMLAGVLCALVSHPADTVLSKLNQKSYVVGGGGASDGGSDGGTGAPLLASTIAAAHNGSMGGATGAPPSAWQDVIAVMRGLGWRGVWKGLAPRLLMVSILSAMQWVVYDSFKVSVGLPTTGGTIRKG
ncbi:phosphate carrier protein mitochondrial precursor-like protein [Leptomonas seymouri]|uniref:Phosphate carrier protein mitochondrial-like protein n=1 Tax=Leptomonas seymouri TaxID=5684 RepID=A0A0N0P3H8_LEPSE|nr:phosphate carrier protein mitochondrial precursor-like protein [Leptomonas seymouri]|eukprot:KPI84136.1 phosphate carrier protein mitochondrial precursor-like protein [Leptomonas seymouri]